MYPLPMLAAVGGDDDDAVHHQHGRQGQLGVARPEHLAPRAGEEILAAVAGLRRVQPALGHDRDGGRNGHGGGRSFLIDTWGALRGPGERWGTGGFAVGLHDRPRSLNADAGAPDAGGGDPSAALAGAADRAHWRASSAPHTVAGLHEAGHLLGPDPAPAVLAADEAGGGAGRQLGGEACGRLGALPYAQGSADPVFITRRSPSTVRRCTQARPPSGSQTRRQSKVSATICSGTPRAR